MNFTNAISSGFTRYFDFEGRSSRSECWWWILFIYLLNYILPIFETSTLSISFFTDHTIYYDSLFFIAVFIPTLAVSIRRLHDLDYTGWWMLLWFLPVVGWIILLILFCTKGSEGYNRFGPDPLVQ